MMSANEKTKTGICKKIYIYYLRYYYYFFEELYFLQNYIGTKKIIDAKYNLSNTISQTSQIRYYMNLYIIH